MPAASIERVMHMGMTRRPPETGTERVMRFRDEHKKEFEDKGWEQRVFEALSAIEKSMNEVIRALNAHGSAIEALRDAMLNIEKAINAIDAHEIRKLNERLLSKTTAEEVLEERRKADRIRKNRWAEKQRGE